MNYRQMAIFLVICGLQILVGNWVGAKGYASGAAAAAFVESIPGLLVLLAIIVGGVAVAHFIPWKGLPAVALHSHARLHSYDPRIPRLGDIHRLRL